MGHFATQQAWFAIWVGMPFLVLDRVLLPSGPDLHLVSASPESQLKPTLLSWCLQYLGRSGSLMEKMLSCCWPGCVIKQWDIWPSSSPSPLTTVSVCHGQPGSGVLLGSAQHQPWGRLARLPASWACRRLAETGAEADQRGSFGPHLTPPKGLWCFWSRREASTEIHQLWRQKSYS